MGRSSFRHVVTAVGGGFVLGSALLVIVALLNGGVGFANCTAMSGAGWTIPLLAGLVIGGVALVLLNSSSASGDRADDLDLTTSPCASCGHPISQEWRLCPHCGALLECDVTPPPALGGD